MPSIGKISKKLNKAFDGKVSAEKENGCLVLTGELERWHEVVKAGMIAVAEKPKLGVVNKITCTADKPMPIRKPKVEDDKLEGEEPDVLIIGAGVIGCAVARELSRYGLKLLIIEKEHDVAVQASGRCNGLVHSGIKLKTKTDRLSYTIRGGEMLSEVCEELSVPFTRCGQYFINPKQMWAPFLFLTRLYWIINGIKGVLIAKSGELLANEPGITHNIGSALYLPTGGVICPQELTIAYAENAVQNGCRIAFNTMAQEMSVEGGMIKSVTTNRGTIRPKIVINAAGLFCEDIAEMAGDRFYSIRPVRGTSIVVDKRNADSLIRSVAVSTLSGSTGKKRRRRGSSMFFNVTRTVHGTVIVGPAFIESVNKEDFSTDRFSVDKVIADGKTVVPELKREHVIEYFSSTAACTYEGDFIVKEGRDVSNIIHAAGIQFPGMTASPAIAEDIAKKVIAMFGGTYNVSLNAEYNPRREAPPAVRMMDANTHESYISNNPDYGIIVCHCEQVSRGEIVGALNGSLACDSLDAVKLRTRAGCGRCHGQQCMHSILRIIAKEKGLPPHNVRKSSRGSEMLYGDVAVIEENRRKAAKERERRRLEKEAFSEDKKLVSIAAEAESKTGGANESEAEGK